MYSYGLIWLAKHFVFPDPQWNRRVTLMGGVSSFALVLGPYWLAPYLLISRSGTLYCATSVCFGVLVVYALKQSGPC